ncbi:unnamed protein product [Closterium sp. Naga37s-1]|nr:unnamed protein product [Closterium sp. Naga37s-1]
MAPRDLQPLTAAPSPLASAPRDPLPLAAAPVPYRVMKGGGGCGRQEGICSTSPLRPPPLFLHLSTVVAAVGGKGMGVAGVAHIGFMPVACPAVARAAPAPPPPAPTFLLHPPAAGAALGGRGSAVPAPLPPPLLLHLSAAGAAVGGRVWGWRVWRVLLSPERLLHRPPPAPPFLLHPPAVGAAVGGRGSAAPAPPAPPPPFLQPPPAAGAAVGEGMGVVGV